ncbi:GntR family transcriptional regulator [Corallococcus coralloides DSM 2259]|uniref:GntR family transcriptional regulator n=1 Tax=Corallococcus coralloides (strain ATCC 25202 / DSM 2259 / NBRC 100086 / M2) TaxID=1144275 RepID=H8MYB3_CORCM|nr:GntR family transcriptional regulator [Corallococcus coralloides]AFE03426.1 GntR family transcriptional regulator [Corallococcus coralloides DSM 2259]
MGMGRGGLVAYVEAQIERDIALGRLHPSGQFGSEAKLARRYEVCRGTLREALRRLAARGLVVQHPGRKTRAVALDESLTLENLGLALHDASNPQARWLLEGYFSLKRQVLLELLADCCARASDLDLDRLGSTCFQLQDAARWEPGETCAQVEFELLRQAARVAARPGHVLLVQSLQRAFMGGAARLLPLMGGEALREWAFRVMTILHERDVQALQHELPALLKARDELVLNAFAPAPQAPAPSEAPCTQEDLLSPPMSATVRGDALETLPCAEERDLGAPASVPGQDESLKARLGVEEHGFDCLVATAEQYTSPEAIPGEAEQGPCHLATAAEENAALGVALSPHMEALFVTPHSGKPPSPVAPGLSACELQGECTKQSVADAALENPSNCRSGWGVASPEKGLQPEAPPPISVTQHA